MKKLQRERCLYCLDGLVGLASAFSNDLLKVPKETSTLGCCYHKPFSSSFDASDIASTKKLALRLQCTLIKGLQDN